MSTNLLKASVFSLSLLSLMPLTGAYASDNEESEQLQVQITLPAAPVEKNIIDDFIDEFELVDGSTLKEREEISIFTETAKIIEAGVTLYNRGVNLNNCLEEIENKGLPTTEAGILKMAENADREIKEATKNASTVLDSSSRLAKEMKYRLNEFYYSRYGAPVADVETTTCSTTQTGKGIEAITLEDEEFELIGDEFDEDDLL